MESNGKMEPGFVSQALRIVNVELRKLLRNELFSATETGVIMCIAIGCDTPGHIAH